MIFVALFILMLGVSLYLLAYGIRAGLIKKRVLNRIEQTYWTGGTAMAIGTAYIIAGALGLYACYHYWDDFWGILKVLLVW